MCLFFIQYGQLLLLVTLTDGAITCLMRIILYVLVLYTIGSFVAISYPHGWRHYSITFLRHIILHLPECHTITTVVLPHVNRTVV